MGKPGSRLDCTPSLACSRSGNDQFPREFYLQGLTPPPAPTLRIRLQWSKIDPLGRTHRFLSGVWAGYRNAAWGLSKGVQLLAGFPGVFNAPVRQAQDPAVRTRTSLRTPWRIDL